jgi:multidrug resistance efflux pump
MLDDGMHLRFQRPDRPQDPAPAPAPARLRRFQLLGLLFGIAAVAGLAVFGWRWRQRDRIDTYGVVSARLVDHLAQVRSRVESIYVEPGDRVRVGEVLFVLTSEEAATELQRVNEELRQERLRLAALLAGPGREAALDEERELASANALIDERQRQRAELSRRHQEAEAGRQAALDEARQQVDKIELLDRQTQQRLPEVRLLARLDAATVLDLRAAEAAAQGTALDRQVAAAALQRQLDAAALAAVMARREDELLYQALARASAERDRLAELCRNLRQSRLQAFEAQARLLADRAGPTEIRTQVDGVVLSVSASAGGQVPADAVVMRVVDGGAFWIDAYVPPSRSVLLARCRKAVVQPLAGGRARLGTIAGSDHLTVPVPPVLRDRFADEPFAVQVRLDLTDSVGLVPGSVVGVALR